MEASTGGLAGWPQAGGAVPEPRPAVLPLPLLPLITMTQVSPRLSSQGFVGLQVGRRGWACGEKR